MLKLVRSVTHSAALAKNPLPPCHNRLIGGVVQILVVQDYASIKSSTCSYTHLAVRYSYQLLSNLKATELTIVQAKRVLRSHTRYHINYGQKIWRKLNLGIWLSAVRISYFLRWTYGYNQFPSIFLAIVMVSHNLVVELIMKLVNSLVHMHAAVWYSSLTRQPLLQCNQAREQNFFISAYKIETI
jgi:hypothetical protein